MVIRLGCSCLVSWIVGYSRWKLLLSSLWKKDIGHLHAVRQQKGSNKWISRNRNFLPEMQSFSYFLKYMLHNFLFLKNIGMTYFIFSWFSIILKLLMMYYCILLYEECLLPYCSGPRKMRRARETSSQRRASAKTTTLSWGGRTTELNKYRELCGQVLSATFSDLTLDSSSVLPSSQDQSNQ